MNEILALLRHTADGAYIIDQDQRIAFWNESAERLLGYSAEEVVGELCWEILGGQTEGNCPLCRRDCVPFATATQGDLVPNFDVRVRTKSGQRRWVNVSIISLPAGDEEEGTRGVLHLFRDVEAKKKAESFAQEVAAQARQLGLQQAALAASPGAENNGALEEEIEELTPREFQVLQLLAAGADTTTMADELYITEATVRNHVQRILRKLHVHSRLEAVACARELGLL